MSTERGQQRVGSLSFDDPRKYFEIEGFDVGGVGKVGIGHDCRRIRVGEYDSVALLAKDPTRLGTRVVEFTRLTDDDRARANQQDGFDVSTARH